MIRVGNGWAPSGPEFAKSLFELMIKPALKDLSRAEISPELEREYERLFGDDDTIRKA